MSDASEYTIVSSRTAAGHQPLSLPPFAHRGPISGIAANARVVITAGYDNQVVITDRATGRPVDRVYLDHLANHLAIAPDGEHFAVASSDYTARIYRFDGRHARLVAVLDGHGDDAEKVAFAPSGRAVATCSRDRAVRLFALDGAPRLTLAGHDADVIGVAFAGEDTLVSTSDDGTAIVWNLREGRQTARLRLGAESDAVAVSTDGVIYVGTDDGEIVRVDGRGRRAVVRAHTSGVKALAIGDGRLLSTSYDGTAALWSTGGDVPVQARRYDVPACVWPRSVAFADTDTVVFGTFGTRYATLRLADGAWEVGGVDAYPSLNAVRRWDGATWAVGDSGIVHRDGVPVRTLPSLCNFLLPWSGRLLAGGQTGAVFDVVTGDVVAEAGAPVNCGTQVGAGPEARAVIGVYGGKVLVIDARLGVDEVALHGNAVKGLATSGDLVFSVSADGTVAQHAADDLARGPIARGRHDRIVNGCAALPNGAFASVSRDRTLRIWSGDAAEVIDAPHPHSIKCVAAGADGRFIATGGYRGTIAVYDTEARAWVGVVRASATGISSLAQGATPTEFLASSYDGSVYHVAVARAGAHDEAKAA